MKKELFTKDLSKVEGTYTFAITNNLKKINEAYYSKTISPIEFKKVVLDIVDNESVKKTPGQRKFVMNMSKKNTKDQIVMYVYEAQLNGSGNGVL